MTCCLKTASIVAQLVKNPPAMRKIWVRSRVGKIPWRRERLPIPIFWPGEFHGLYSLWGRKESDTTEQLSLTSLNLIPWTIQSMEFSRPEYWSASLSLLQGIFPTQGLNPGLPHCRQILYQLSYQGSPRILESVAYAFSSRSSWLRYQTGVSCIAGGFFTSWATWVLNK